MHGLFQLGSFELASGMCSSWKIEGDALGPEDWACLAALAVDLYGRPSEAIGVPRGGLPFARALQHLLLPHPHGRKWIVDDVFTTGGSIAAFRQTLPPVEYHVVVAFARSPLPAKHRAVFVYGSDRE